MKTRIFYILSPALLALDQFSKHMAVTTLPPCASRRVAGGLFHLTLVHNTGGAFGVLNSMSPLLVLTAVLAAAGIVFIAHRYARESAPALAALALMLGGTLGNLIDRIHLGYVVDFIDVGFWPVFNVADMAILVGVALFAICLYHHDRRRSALRAGETTPGE